MGISFAGSFFFLFLAIILSSTAATPSVADLGSISLILNNDLDPNTPKISALLISSPLSFSNASTACQLAGEELFQFSSNITTEIAEIAKGLQGRFPDSSLVKRSISHLRRRKKYQRASMYWISNNATSSNGTTQCQALVLTGSGQGDIVQTACAQELPILCSNANVQENTYLSPPDASKIIVDTPVGSFRGFRTLESFVFRGIKYATAERFQSPVPYIPPQGVNDATSFGSECAQPYMTAVPLGEEDCLFLNVFTPRLPDNSSASAGGLPVMFWIHGGSFIQGSGSSVHYNGQNLANRGEVVVVTINYRLGVLGWFEAVDSGFPRSLIPGNQALRDWIVALQWVQSNVAAFGGDPSKVTIFGQSAGAGAVRTLLSTPKAKGLFRAAIAQSDPIDVPFNSEKTASGLLGAAYVNVSGCAAGDVNCLKSTSLDVLLEYTGSVIRKAPSLDSALPLFEVYKPTIDGDMIPGDFYDLLQNGEFNDVPLMAGTVRDEADAFVPFIYVVPDMPASDIPSSINKTYGSNRTQILLSANIYSPNPNESDSVRHLLGQIGTDYYWTCPLQLLMSYYSSKGTPYFSYVMNRGYAIPRPDPLFCHNKVCHADDIYVVFGSQKVAEEPVITADDILFSRIVQDRWASFAHNLNPNPPFTSDVQLTWPAHTPNSPNVMQFDIAPQVTEGYRAPFCNVVNNVAYDFQLGNQ